LSGTSGRVVRYTFSPNGQRLAIVGGNPALPTAPGEVKILDLRDDQDRLSLARFGPPPLATDPYGVCFSPDGKWLAVASGKTPWSAGPGEVSVWDADTGRERFSLAAHARQAYAVAFRRDGLLASAGDDFLVKLLDARTGKERKALRQVGAAT